MATTDFWHPTPRSMSLTRLVVMRPRSRGAPRARSPATTGVSRGWVHELVKRYDAEGEAGLVPRSRRQRTSPQRKPEALAYEVVQLRKHLAKQGLDAGAVTIAYDLAQRHGRASARSTTWRILSRRASSPCSHKRPKGSYVRFEAGDAQQALAGRRDPLQARRRCARRGPQPDQRLLPVPGHQPRPGRSKLSPTKWRRTQRC